MIPLFSVTKKPHAFGKFKPTVTITWLAIVWNYSALFVIDPALRHQYTVGIA